MRAEPLGTGGEAVYCCIMRLASVILDIPTQALDTPYTYLVPEDAPAEAAELPVLVGCAVLVPFGHRQAVGFVVALEEVDRRSFGKAGRGRRGSAASKRITASAPNTRMPARAPAARVPASTWAGSSPSCARCPSRTSTRKAPRAPQWLSERYLAPLSSCVRLFTPPGGVPRMVRAREGYWRLEEPAVGEVDDRWVVPGPAFGSFEPRKNAVKQASIVAALRAGELRVAELTAEFGAVSSPLKALERQGVVRVERRRRMRGVPVDSLRQPAAPGPPACRPAGLRAFNLRPSRPAPSPPSHPGRPRRCAS